MQALPYSRSVTAIGTGVGAIKVVVENLALAPNDLNAGEPEDGWSPEVLLLASAARCYILAFRSLAYVSKLAWRQLECEVTGQVDRADGVVRFTRIKTSAKLSVPETASEDLCHRVLRKTERICLIANSLRAERDLALEVVRSAPR